MEPSKIDDTILLCEGVAQVGVAGIPASYFDPSQDNKHFLPRAFVIKKPGSNLTVEDMVKFVEGILLKLSD